MKNIRPNFDPEIVAICDYVMNYQVNSTLAYDTAYYDLLDSLACAFLALQYPACQKLLGPIVPGATLAQGARVPGTSYQLEPVQAAFNFGALVRWLDYNDTWLAAEWGHPSDNLGGILMVADYLNRQSDPRAFSTPTFSIHDIWTAMIKAHEIQGIFALENAFNRVGLDHVILVKVATTAVVAQLLGGNREQIQNALSLAWVDGHSLRTYRHAPNTGSRKSWAAGDATSRGVRLALMAMQGEMGYPSALSAPKWGFCDVYLSGHPLRLPRPFGSYVMENVLFKISFPAEFHAQTAVEAAIQHHPQVKNRLDEISRVTIKTQEAAKRIIDKTGTLYNPADRDHCIQYMTAIGLIFGDLNAQHYEDSIAADSRIDALREKMQVTEEVAFSQDYLDPNKRSITNAVQIFFHDGSCTEEIKIEYPIGHPVRRQAGIPLIKEKFVNSVQQHFTPTQAERLITTMEDKEKLATMAVHDLVDLTQKQ